MYKFYFFTCTVGIAVETNASIFFFFIKSSPSQLMATCPKKRLANIFILIRSGRLLRNAYHAHTVSHPRQPTPSTNPTRTLTHPHHNTHPTPQIEALAQGIDLSLPISRAKFEELNMDLFKRTLQPVAQVLKDAVRT